MHLTKPIRFASVCDGISAVGCAWKPLGWEFVFKSEIEPFPSAVADLHHPEAPNLGDMTRFAEWNDYGIDLVCGGTPCQAFSVAGLRKGLADPRGNLTLTYLALIAKHQPRWVVWENVPGVLSDKTGAFGSFLGGMGELGYGLAYRVLDAQYFGVAQRRRRVFVVGHIGGFWQRAAAVLFERDCLSGNPAPRRETRERFTHDVASSLGASGRGFERAGETRGQDPVIAVTPSLTSNGDAHSGFRDEHGLIAHSLRAEGFYASEDGTGRGTPLVPTVLAHGQGNAERVSDGSPSLTCNHEAPIAFLPQGFTIHGTNKTQRIASGTELAGSIRTKPPGSQENSSTTVAVQSMAVRRLTPRECERLQGFPDDYTLIPFRKKPAADGPRYKALGNSMAVPVMRWIGARIQAVEDIVNARGIHSHNSEGTELK